MVMDDQLFELTQQLTNLAQGLGRMEAKLDNLIEADALRAQQIQELYNENKAIRSEIMKPEALRRMSDQLDKNTADITEIRTILKPTQEIKKWVLRVSLAALGVVVTGILTAKIQAVLEAFK
jgi:hypothetical protein